MGLVYTDIFSLKTLFEHAGGFSFVDSGYSIIKVCSHSAFVTEGKVHTVATLINYICKTYGGQTRTGFLEDGIQAIMLIIL